MGARKLNDEGIGGVGLEALVAALARKMDGGWSRAQWYLENEKFFEAVKLNFELASEGFRRSSDVWDGDAAETVCTSAITFGMDWTMAARTGMERQRVATKKQDSPMQCIVSNL